MKYSDFEKIMTPARMSRYLAASNKNTKTAMTLYRLNLRISQEIFTIISCFEVTLRNAINYHCLNTLGNDWLRCAAAPGGIFDNRNCLFTQREINSAISDLNHHYTHDKLVAGLGFGFWRFMFASHQYSATGRSLINIFPSKPISTAVTQYNQTFVFNQLAAINRIRNRIAHHEPICFRPMQMIKDTTYIRQHYVLIKQLFQWMNIDESALLYGLDHIITVCAQIDNL